MDLYYNICKYEADFTRDGGYKRTSGVRFFLALTLVSYASDVAENFAEGLTAE